MYDQWAGAHDSPSARDLKAWRTSENPGAAGYPAAVNWRANSARTARYTDGASREITVPESMSTLLAPSPDAVIAAPPTDAPVTFMK